MPTKKKISVCIATYNGEKYIKEQLDSILHQLKPTDEVIISDDGSIDNTVKIIENLNDDRVQILNNKVKKGVVGNFENALNHCTGDYIFLSDQDDVWLPNKIPLSIIELEEYDLVVSNCKVVDSDLNIIANSYFDIANSGTGFLKNFYRSTYLGCCLAFRSSVQMKILPIPLKLRMFHDWWIGLIADTQFHVKFIQEPCMLYRRHDSNFSTTTSKSKQSITKRIFDRFQLLYYGLLRITLNK